MYDGYSPITAYSR